MSFLYTKTGEQILIDDEFYESLSKLKWYKDKDGYAVSPRPGKSNKMHRLVMNAAKGTIVDHINRNKLDNRKVNLRLCSVAENLINTGLSPKNTSGYRGVCRNKTGWQVQIYENNKPKYLGTFEDKNEAAEVWNEATRQKYGEFCYQNVIRH